MVDQTIVVTGASSGIGKRTCEHFLGLGFRVFGIARRKSGIVDEKFSEIECDITDDESVSTSVGQLMTISSIKALINCAGMTKPEETIPKVDSFKETFEVNLFGAYRMIFYLLPLLERHSESSIVNIASIGGMVGFPNNPAYGASKAALINLTKNLAIDFHQKNIRVNSVSPGYFRTEMTKKSYVDTEARQLREHQTIMKRYGEPHELMGILEFLISEKSSYITGQNFVVDGGWMSKGLKL